MQSAAFYLMASFFAVSYGWRPMPDDSQSYEYVVQLDQELVSRLERGESIPISTDIPEEIQPIRRIRLVVGNENLPRQKLVTALKPEQSDSTGDVVRGQYTESAPRYPSNTNTSNPILPANSPARQILPRAQEVENSVNALGDALQRSAQEARNVAETQILPRVREVLPPENRPILPKNSTARVSDTIRNTNASNDSAIRELFAEPPTNPRNNVQVADQRNTPGSTYTPQNNSTTTPILPRGNSQQRGNNPNNNLASQPNGAIAPRYSATTETNNNRAISPPARNLGTDSNSPQIKARWPEEKRFESSPLAQEYNSGNGRYGKPQETVPNPRQERAPTNPNSFNLAAERNQEESVQAPELSFPNDARYNNTTAAAKQPQSPQNVPEIRREMLNRPADEELRMASHNDSSIMPTSISQAESAVNNAAPNAGQLPANMVAQQQPDSRLPANNQSNTGAKTFPLILAWVLLSGSGAGNLYLVWSYMDIRSKYRGLVRSAGRKLGRRYLDDRYGEPDEYDD